MGRLGHGGRTVDAETNAGTHGGGGDDGGVGRVGASWWEEGGSVGVVGEGSGLFRCAFGGCGDVEDVWLRLSLVMWTRRARGFCESLSKSFVCAGGDFFGCHRTVGFPGVVDGLADLGFGLFLLTKTLCRSSGFGHKVYLAVAREIRAESTFARRTTLRSCSRDGR